MDVYHHESGAQKRKEKKTRVERSAQGQRTLESAGFAVFSHLSEHESQNEGELLTRTSELNIDKEHDNLTVVVADDVEDDDDNEGGSGSSTMITCASGTDTTIISEPYSSYVHKAGVTEVCSISYSKVTYNVEVDSNKKLFNFDKGLLQPCFSVAQIEDAI